MKLKAYLKQVGKTVEAFAVEIDESKFTVGKWVRGERRPRDAALTKIIRATNGEVGAADFYGGADILIANDRADPPAHVA